MTPQTHMRLPVFPLCKRIFLLYPLLLSPPSNWYTLFETPGVRRHVLGTDGVTCIAWHA